MNKHEQSNVFENARNYSLDKTNVETLAEMPKLTGKLEQFSWPIELQGRGDTNEKDKELSIKFPVGDIFLSYVTTIHELGHLRQEELNPNLKNNLHTHKVLYAQEEDAWERGWARFIKANPNLVANLNRKISAYNNQGKIKFESLEELYSWIQQNVLKIVEVQNILFGESAETKEEKMDYIADELKKIGIENFFTDYKASRVGEKVQVSEIKEAINETIKLIIKE